MKEQSKNSPDQTNEEEIGSLPEKEFRVMIVNYPKAWKQNGENTRNVQLGPRRTKEQTNNDEHTINEIKNSLEGINSRIPKAEERRSDLEDKVVEITTAEQNKEKRMKRTEDSLRDHWDNIN